MARTDDSPFVSYHNARFGFRVLIPTDWQTYESTNSDGITATHPDANDVEIRAYAHAAVADTSLNEWVLNTLLGEREKDGFRLLEQAVETVMIESSLGVKEPRECERISYEMKLGDRPYRCSWLFAQYRDTQFAVRFEAPSDKYQHYFRTYERVAGSLAILNQAL